MDPQTLQTFRQQLLGWIDKRLETGRYPFRCIEKEPAVFCSSGLEHPDLVLWINRDSCLAGGIILLTSGQDSCCIQRGSHIAHALGLENFILWDTHEAAIWSGYQQQCKKLEALELSASQPISPCDFERVLDQLLSRLKVLAVTGMLAAETLPPHFFANLCKITMENVLPGQTEASRTTADGMQPDTWAAKMPVEKIWLTLWRLLLLVHRGMLPPSLQPHRLEQAMKYAMADLEAEERSVFAIQSSEPALSGEASVCFHQLATRLQQLRWPAASERAAKTVNLLLHHSAATFAVANEAPAGALRSTDLAVNYLPPVRDNSMRLVAPRACLAGWTLLADLSDTPAPALQASSVHELRCDKPPENIIAQLRDDAIPLAEERERRLIGLREAWPNHRFTLPREAPVWLWEALHLCGITAQSGVLDLILPSDWAFSPGADLLWNYLLKRMHLLTYGSPETGGTLLRFGTPDEDQTVLLLRSEGNVQIAGEMLLNQGPGMIHFCLKCDPDVLQLFLDGNLRPYHGDTDDAWKALANNACLFLNSSVGLHVWQRQTGATQRPDITHMTGELFSRNLLLPARDVLGAFALLDWDPSQPVPAKERLDRVLHACWGKLPAIRAARQEKPEGKSGRLMLQRLRKDIAKLVFVDGLPLFPEHYLMQHYRPELRSYTIPGPLEFQDRFFGRIFLQTPDGTGVEVEDEATASALQVLSCSDRQTVQLPVDAALTEKILNQYLTDLEKLWKALLRECRRRIPMRQQALSAARKIWKDHKLPPRDKIAGHPRG